MGRSLSMDLRERVVRFVEQGNSRRAAGGSLAQRWRRSDFPLPQTDLFCDLRKRYAEGSETVHNGGTDLELRDLTVEVPRHEALAQQFHAMHLGFDAASAVVAAPSSPDGAPEAA